MEDNGYFIKTLFRKQAALNILALLVSTIGPVTCMILVGRYFGSEGLAIMAICTPLFFAASFLGFTISGGAQVLCSVFIAKDEINNVNMVYSAALTLTLLAAVLISAAMVVFKTPLLMLIAGDISPYLSAYYNFFVLYAFITMFVYIPLFFSRVVGRAEIGLILTGIMAVGVISASLIFVQFMGIEARQFDLREKL